MDANKRLSWLLLSAISIALILACLPVQNLVTGGPTTTPVNEVTHPAPEPPGSIEEPTDEPAESPVEPVTIRLVQSGDERIPVGTPVQLTIGWVASTEEQVADFLRAVSLTGTLDGQPLTDLNDYWEMIEPYEGEVSGLSEAYISTWLYPLGLLSPGTHTVEILGTLEQPVTDGYDANNDGQPEEYSGEIFQYTLSIIVEE